MAPIYPVSLMELLDGSELERYLFGKKALQVGELLEGRVIKIINQGEALIDFGRFRAKAMIHIPLTEGEQIRVVVVETGEKIRFQIQNPIRNVFSETLVRTGFLEKNQWIDLPRIADFVNRITEQLADGIQPGQSVSADLSGMPTADGLGPVKTPFSLASVGDFQSILATLANLRNLVKAIDLTGDSQAIASKLTKLLHGSGFFTEARLLSLASSHGRIENLQNVVERIDWTAFIRQLENQGQADVKHQLGQLLTQLKNFEALEKTGQSEGGRLAPARAEVEAFLNSMISQHRQILEESQLRQDNQAVFSFNLPFEESKINGKMKLYLKKGKKKNQSTGWRISLLLDLSRVGGIRVDLYYMPQVLRLTFFVADRIIQEEIMTFSPDLIEHLQGFIESVHFEVLVSKAKIDHFEAEDWVEESGDSQAGLDIKA